MGVQMANLKEEIQRKLNEDAGPGKVVPLSQKEFKYLTEHPNEFSTNLEDRVKELELRLSELEKRFPIEVGLMDEAGERYIWNGERFIPKSGDPYERKKRF